MIYVYDKTTSILPSGTEHPNFFQIDYNKYAVLQVLKNYTHRYVKQYKTPYNTDAVDIEVE